MTRRRTHLHPALMSATLLAVVAYLSTLGGCSIFSSDTDATTDTTTDAAIVPAKPAVARKIVPAEGPISDDVGQGSSVAIRDGADAPALVGIPSAGPEVDANEGAAPGPTPLALIHPDDPEVDHLLEAETALADGDGATALIQFRRSAFDLDDFESYLGIGRAARATGDRELALRAFEAAAEKDKEVIEPLISGARIALAMGKVRKGLNLIDRALARQPGSAEAFNVRGRLWMSKQQYQKALIAFDRAIDLDPSFVWAYNNAGYIHLVTGDYEEAVDLLEVATTLEPARAYMFNNLGLAYEKVGRVEEARQTFVKSLSLRPGYVNAHLNLSRVKTRLAMATIAPSSPVSDPSETSPLTP